MQVIENKLRLKSMPIDFAKGGKNWAYFGKASNWEDVPKPEVLAHLPRCVICRLAIEIQQQTNIYCWNCWKICIRPDKSEHYESLIQCAIEMASKDPSFHGKYFIGRGRPVIIIRVGSEEERDALFAQILEDLKDRGLYPKDSRKRWWHRGCSRFESALGKWRYWKNPVNIKKKTISKIIQISTKGNANLLKEW